MGHSRGSEYQEAEIIFRIWFRCPSRQTQLLIDSEIGVFSLCFSAVSVSVQSYLLGAEIVKENISC